MAIDTWAKLIDLPNPDFRILIEGNPRAECECGSDWTSEGSNTYSHACVEVKVNRVTDDNQDCTEKSSLAEVQATAGSFWFDKANQKLYVHAFNDDDLSNSATTIIIMVFVWKHFSTDVCEFNSIQYMPFVRRNSVPSLELEVEDIIEGTFKFNFGGFSLNNPNRWWDTVAVVYNWSDCQMLIKVGGEDLPYGEYELYGVGYVSDYVVQDETVSFALRDIRAFATDSVPLEKYNQTTYPNLSVDDVGKPIPLFYGRKNNISPTCTNPGISNGGRWKIAASRTIRRIRAVRLGDKTLDPASEYTQYLAVAEFELDIPYNDEEIQVDADGFVEGTELIVKASPIAKDLVKTYAGYTDDDLDLTSFATASDKRTQELCIYLDEETSVRDVLETIGRSVVGFFVPTEGGKFAFEIYEDDVPSGVMTFYDRDYYPDWKVKKDDRYVRNKVRVRYDKNPTTQDFEAEDESDSSVIYKYGIRKTLNVETYLKREDEAKDLAEAILGMCKQPITLVETSVGVRAFGLYPTRKIKLSRSRAVSSTGSWSEKTFRVRSVGKNMNVEQTHLSAMDDLEMVTKICHVCVTCQFCNTCETQVGCAKCDDCEACVDCMTCVSTQECAGCDSCDSCELCVGCQASCQSCQNCDSCESCQACESCYDCQTCDVCDGCELCVACMVGDTCAKCDNCQTCVAAMECTACDSCDSCELCVSGCQASCQTCQSCDSCESCQTCQSCVVCQTCDSCDSCELCVACMVGDTCAKCDTCQTCVATMECTVCDSCDSCELCVGCQASCQTCQSCNTCESCQTCQSCVVCQTCDSCDSCELCVACMVADTCAKCDNCQTCVATMECTVCDSCDNCELCVGCQASCQTCQSCNTCQSCQTCQSCYVCQTCDSCDTCELCVGCMVRDTCAKCDTCQTCVAAMECTVCDSCDSCELCVGCQASCQTCQNCNTCESCQTCQSCVVCQTCDECDTCQSCVSCTKCNDCQSCVGCMVCATCDVCNTCQVCVSCYTCEGCVGCDTCYQCEAEECHLCDTPEVP